MAVCVAMFFGKVNGKRGPMDRRNFLKVMGASTLGLMLSGCGLKSRRDAVADDSVDDTGEITYRTLPHGNIKISTIGIGASALHESTPAELEQLVAYAADRGINLMDTVMSDFSSAEALGRGMKGRRDKFYLQMHIGATYPNNGYVRTRELAKVREGFEKQLKTFGTDYCDFGLIHYVDEDADYDAAINNGLLDYAQQLKQAGTIRYIGFSSHSVDISRRFLATGLIDLFMFSLNPAYDFVSPGNGLVIDSDRKALYEEAQRRGAAITVMKAYGGSRLLSEASSPFGRALTPTQCIHYALERPAVISCLPGVRNLHDLKSALLYYKATPEERDYSFIFGTDRKNMDGVCIYCGHCQPCRVGIDIAASNKYYDLAQTGDNLAKNHYLKMTKRAGDCIQCGDCEPRCPFHVKIRERMKETAAYFGK